MIDLPAQVESLLFLRGDSVSIAWLAKTLKVHESKITLALEELEKNLSVRGVRLVRSLESAALVTAKEMSPIIEDIRKKETEEELSKAALEVLSIVIYAGGASKKEIDYVRGVNSQISLRNLAIRGLIQKKEGERGTYEPTVDLIRFLGLESLSELPRYEELRKGMVESLREKANE